MVADLCANDRLTWSANLRQAPGVISSTVRGLRSGESQLVRQAGGNRDRLCRVMFRDLHRGMIPDWWPLMGHELMNAAGARNWPRSRPVGEE